MAARTPTPKQESIDETQPGPTQDLDQVPAQTLTQTIGHAPIHDFGQAPAQDLARESSPGPAQIPAPVAGYHRDIILPALIEISGAIRNHDRRLDNTVTKADSEATTETAAKSQQAQERRIDALPNAEAFAALVNENTDLKEQLRSFKQVQDELVEGFRRTGQGAGEPERDDALPLRRVSASGNGDGDGDTMNLGDEEVNEALEDQKALIKMTSDDESAVQSYGNNNFTGNQEAKTALLNSALARPREQSLHLEHLSTSITPWVDEAGRLRVPSFLHDDSYDELAKFWHTQMQELRFIDGSLSTLSAGKKCLRTVLLGRNDRWTTDWPGEYACGHCADEHNMCLRQYDGRLWALPLPRKVLGQNPILLHTYIPAVELITRSQEGVRVWRD